MSANRRYLDENNKTYSTAFRSALTLVFLHSRCDQHVLKLYLIEYFVVFINGDIDFPQYLPYQRSGQNPSSVMGYCGRSTIRMSVENMAALLPYTLKSKGKKHLL